MIITKEEATRFKNAEVCRICNKKYTKENIPVRDHCHVTGKYKGYAHNTCSRSIRLSNIVPIIFHNLRGYDGQEIGKFKRTMLFQII